MLSAGLYYASRFFYYRYDNEYPSEATKSQKLPRLGRNVTSGFLFVAVGTAFFIPTLSLVTSYLEEVTDVGNTKSWKNGTIFININYPDPLNIPVTYSLEGKSKEIIVEIDKPKNVTIRFVKLVSPSDPLISTSGNFKPITNKTDSKILNNIVTAQGMTLYHLPIKAVHLGEISNKTYNYSLNVGYTDTISKTNEIKQITIPFNWTVVMKDLGWLNYLWIVMAGVVASRFITFIADTKKTEPINIDRTESLWIAFTFIIAILAFASFKDNVTLGSIVLFNVLIAFAFGFGSQKVLELARAFPGSSSITPAQVTGLELVSDSKQIKLKWDQNPETDIDYYYIYRGEAPGFPITAQAYTHRIPSKDTTFTDTGLDDPNKTYYYRVSAVNKDGNIGRHSTEKSANPK